MSEHKDGDPDKTKEEYDQDNHADQENPNNDEYDKDWAHASDNRSYSCNVTEYYKIVEFQHFQLPFFLLWSSELS